MLKGIGLRLKLLIRYLLFLILKWFLLRLNLVRHCSWLKIFNIHILLLGIRIRLPQINVRLVIIKFVASRTHWLLNCVV